MCCLMTRGDFILSLLVDLLLFLSSEVNILISEMSVNYFSIMKFIMRLIKPFILVPYDSIIFADWIVLSKFSTFFNQYALKRTS